MEHEEMTGFAEYDGNSIPFLFRDNRLLLFPPDEHMQIKQAARAFERWSDNFKSNQWIPQRYIRGITTKKKTVLFHIPDNPSDDNGFLSFRVYNACIYSGDEKNGLMFQKLRIGLEEGNYFYGPSYFWQLCYDERGISDIKPRNGRTDILFGKYTYQGVQVKVRLDEKSSLAYQEENFLTSSTVVVLETSRLIDFDVALDLIHHIKIMFCYLTRRKNIAIKEIEFWKNGKKGNPAQIYGNILLFDQSASETDRHRDRRIIPYSVIKKKADSLLQAIADGELYIEHLPEDISSSSRYNIGEMILNFASFEREFSNLYGKVHGLRSENYYLAQKSACELLEDEAKKIPSKKERKYYRDFTKTIQNSGSSFSAKMSYAIHLHIEDMSSLITSRYGGCDDNIIEGICDRLNQIRNSCVHGNLGLRFEAMHISDLRILQVLVYVMRLNSMKVDAKNIKRAIAGIF